MILLRKFVTFCGERLPARITYGAYEFKSYTRYDSFEVLYKKIRKEFVNCENRIDRLLATFHAGEYKINLRQTYFLTLNCIDYSVRPIVRSRDEYNDCYYSYVSYYNQMSYKKFIDEYDRITRALQVA